MSFLSLYISLAIYSFFFILLLFPLFLLLRKYRTALKIETPLEKTNFFCFRRHDSIYWTKLKLIEFALGMTILVPFRLIILILLSFLIYFNAKIFNCQLKRGFIKSYLQFMVRFYCKSILFISGFYYIPYQKKKFPFLFHHPPPSSTHSPFSHPNWLSSPPSTFLPGLLKPSITPANTFSHPPPPPFFIKPSASLFHPSAPPNSMLSPSTSFHLHSPIIISNHVSWVDGFYLLSKYKSSIIAKKELSRIPLVGEIAKCVEPIFVSRDDRKDKDFVLNRIKERVDEFNQTKTHLIIFPEGTTSNGQALLGFKKGAFASLSPLKIFCLKYNRKSFCPVLDHISSMAGNIILTLCQFYNVLEVVEYEGAFHQEEEVRRIKEEERSGEERTRIIEEKKRMKEGVGAKNEEEKEQKIEIVGERWEEYARRVKEVMSKELEVTMVEMGLRESLEYSKKVKEKLDKKLKKEGDKKLDSSKIHAVRTIDIN